MKRKHLNKIWLSSAGMALLLSACKSEMKEEALVYPETRTEVISDTFFGEVVYDPYRWLETDTAKEVEEWVKKQNDFTFAWLDRIPYRQKLKERLTTLFDYEKYSAPFIEGEYLYYYKNDGLQNQSVLYRQKGENGPAEVFFDPNRLSEDGTVSLSGMSFTEDGSLMAYSISRGGADWQEIYVMNTSTKELLADVVPDVKFSGITWKGNEGFFYSRYADQGGSKLSSKTQNHKVYYHRLGSKVNEDVLVFGRDDDPKRYVGASISDDFKTLVISTAMTTSGNELYYIDLTKPGYKAVPVVKGYEFDHEPVLIRDHKMYVLTSWNSPNRRLMLVDFNKPGQADWKEIIPETENVLNVNKGAGLFFANYLKDAITHVVQYSYDGVKQREIQLPGVGTAMGFGGKDEQSTLYYLFSSYIVPTSIYKYDPNTGKSELYRKPAIQFNTDEYESRQVFYNSKDGTRIPMIITHKKGLKMNGSNPTLLYGYGGFNISLTPSFNTSVLVLLEQGGIYAVPNIRGGGEYGDKWHKSGTLQQKQNVFDDFIAAAEYLISEKYTSSDYLALSGGSNGGLLVGAVMTQRPDLMKVAFPAVGVLDMLRYHKFTAGAGWAADYGTADDNRKMFDYLRAYSPVHNVRKGTAYPATMVTTGDHDDRVVPAHSFKFIASLQANQGGTAPVLIRIDIKAGHGAGKPTSKVIDEQADKFAFMLWNMGIKELK